MVDIFDEVEEELREERMQEFLKKYGVLLFAAALLESVGAPKPNAGSEPIPNRTLIHADADLRAAAPRLAAGSKAAAASRPDTFADWMSTALRREGLTQEAAARQLGVSVKTVGRWVGGETEPRLRDLRRIQELFGELPFP